MTSEKEKVYLEYLVLHCQHRDGKAWEELIGFYEKRLFYYVKQIVGKREDALNILQETWLRAYRSINSLREPASLTSWLYRIAHNVSLRHVHSHRNETSLDRDIELEAHDQTDPQGTFAAEDVHKGLQMLKLEHREVLALFYLEDFSIAQISQVINIPVGTVRSRLHYAKKSLKAILEKENKNERRQ